MIVDFERHCQVRERLYKLIKMSYKALKQAVLNAFEDGSDNILQQVEKRLHTRLAELRASPKDSLTEGIDDISNKQWLQSRTALKEPNATKFAAR